MSDTESLGDFDCARCNHPSTLCQCIDWSLKYTAITPEMTTKVREIIEDKEFLRTGTKIINGEVYRLTDGLLMLQCIKDKEAELGRMIVKHFEDMV